jgi:hypothetical protein
MTLSLPEAQDLLGWRWPEGSRSEMSGLLINVLGTSAILVVGMLVGLLTKRALGRPSRVG